MKKSFTLIILMGVFSLSSVLGQKGSLLLTFKATDYYSQDTLLLDSVLVENPARDCDTTIYGQPSQLMLTWVTGIGEFTKTDGFQVAQNYPNPFAGPTRCNIRLSGEKNLVLVLTDVYGKELAVMKKTLAQGGHTFAIETGANGIYFLSVSDGKTTKTLKLNSMDAVTNKTCSIRYTGGENTKEGFKSTNESQGFTFLPGDMLNLTPYRTGYEGMLFSVAPTSDYTAIMVVKPNELSFYADSISGYVPINATFTPVSNIPNLTSWHWDFGDGETSELENPTHSYVTPNTYYTVTLTAQGPDGDYSVERTNYIHTFNDAANVDFYADYTDGMAPLAVHFMSSTNIQNPSFQWNFGDGFGAQYVSNPYHTYDYPGVYTVTLDVFGNNGQYTETKTDYITVNFCPSTVTDADGNVYNTVSIGSQCWMKENLNVGTKISGYGVQADNGILEKFCWNGYESNCDTYGGLYQFMEFMQYTTEEGAQGICPNGWHIPTKDDFDMLLYFANDEWGTTGGSLKEAAYAHWEVPNTGATNFTSFTALGGGYYERDFCSGYPYYYQLKRIGQWGSSSTYTTEDNYLMNYYLVMGFNFSGAGINDDSCIEYNAYSIRCIKDSDK